MCMAVVIRRGVERVSLQRTPVRTTLTISHDMCVAHSSVSTISMHSLYTHNYLMDYATMIKSLDSSSSSTSFVNKLDPEIDFKDPFSMGQQKGSTECSTVGK